MRLIDYDRLKSVFEFCFPHNSKIVEIVRSMSTIDIETLPIVKELREKLSKYEKMESDGRILPCSIGDTVYSIIKRTDDFIPCEYHVIVKDLFTLDMVTRLGNSVFLTREEAEVSLQKRNYK